MGQKGENRMVSTENIVSQLKTARKEQRLSYQDIVERTEQNGEPVSITTVKRVFSDNPSGIDFRYDNTLKPIARALGITFEPEDEPLDEQFKKVEDEEMQAALSIIKETYEARISDLWSTIKLLRRDKTVLLVVVIILLLFVFYLFADGLHGSWGFFRYPDL